MPPNLKPQARIIIRALGRMYPHRSWLSLAKWVCRSRACYEANGVLVQVRYPLSYNPPASGHYSHILALIKSPQIAPYM